MSVSELQPATGMAETAELITAELERLGPVHVESNGRRWEARIGGKRCRVALTPSWLVFNLPAPRNRPRRAWKLLERNGELPGNARYVLRPDGVVRLRSEVPLQEMWGPGKERLAGDVARALSDLASACGITAPELRSSGAGSGSGDVTAVATGDAAPASSERELSDLCTEAGWPFTERGNGSLSVDLETAGGAFTGMLSSVGETVVLIADLTRGDMRADRDCQEGVAVLLLSATAQVRTVAAITRSDDTGAAMGAEFRVRLPAHATGADLAHGLSAISVACDACGREARVVSKDPQLARLYLEVCHPRWHSVTNTHESHSTEEDHRDQH